MNKEIVCKKEGKVFDSWAKNREQVLGQDISAIQKNQINHLQDTGLVRSFGNEK